jgi:signal transduction histidine kinase
MGNVTDIIDPTKDVDSGSDIDSGTDLDSPVESVRHADSTRQIGSSFGRFMQRCIRVATSRTEQIGRRLSRSSRQSTLRRIPLLVALSTAVVTAPGLWILTSRLVHGREDGNWQFVVQNAQRRTLLAQEMLAGGNKYEDPLVFLVKPNDRYTESLGPTEIEPPLFKLAKAAEAGPAEEWFQQNGQSLQTYTRRYNPDTFIVTIEDVGWIDPANRKFQREARRWSFAVWLLVSTLTGLVIHRLLRPARRILRERIDFLADAAHELRTPLAVIQASAGYALSRERETVDYVQSLAEIRSASERAAVGVSELLDLARFDAGQAVPRLAPLRLDLLAEEIVSSTRLDDCVLTVKTSPTVLVQADMALLRQAVDNLVRNAAARSSEVVLRCSLDASDGIIEVLDDGPGFPPEQLPYVFERYRRGDGRGSLGLGLPIAASIVAAHGGRVDIASPAPHPISAERPGSLVTIRLPRSRT